MPLNQRSRDLVAATTPIDTASRVTAVLGPTNTGKTHYAIERMLAQPSGMIGLPLRLLAREVYDRVVAAKGPDAVALITGEEKIVPRAPNYWVCTVESMPLDKETDFLAIDEIQLCADMDRGHIFTDRLLHARAKHETLFLGSETMRPAIHRLLPQANFISRPRFSDLAYTGSKKITRLPRRTAVVAFSAEAVYGIAELIRRQRGGAAVVMGALSPRTRNAQVALYQSGDVDFLVATDAIGMGLNMDVDHVAFASLEKFDGNSMRALRPQELAQIAGRAGRYMNDGTFGVTGDVALIEDSVVEQIESHRFDPVKTLQWRNNELDFASLQTLIKSLEALPREKGLARARDAEDISVLRILGEEDGIRGRMTAPALVKRLWEVCQVPDFRKVTPQEHANFMRIVFDHLMSDAGVLANDWVSSNVSRLDNVDGDIDMIAQRIAGVRTWTFIANRPGWIKDAVEWQDKTRAIEDRLSDALHEKLTQRFIDRRTSVLMKRLRAEDEFTAVVGEDGECLVDNEYVGRLEGFRFVADPRAIGIHGKALRTAALRGLQGEIAQRAYRLATADDKAFTLSEHGKVWWEESAIARLIKGNSILSPRIELVADEHLTPTARSRAQTRLEKWLTDRIETLLAPLMKLKAATETETAEPTDTALTGVERGMAFRLTENLGAVPRFDIAEEVRALTPEMRAKLRQLGVRFGEFSIYLPLLTKPGPAHLKALLWAVNAGLHQIPSPPPPGLTSTPADPSVPGGFYEASGYRLLGRRAVRLDMLERLADMLRPQRQPKPQAAVVPAPAQAAVTETVPIPEEASAPSDEAATEATIAAPAEAESSLSAATPEPVAEAAPTPVPTPTPAPTPERDINKGFPITPEMLSLLGCAQDDMQEVLGALGYRGRPEVQPDGTTVTLFRPRNRGPHNKPRRPEGNEKRSPEFRPKEERRQQHGKPNRPPHRKPHVRPEAPAATEPQADRVQTDQPQAEKRAQQNQKHRRDRHHGKPPNQPKPEMPRREPKPQREVRIDPNSPFAKLAVLKNLKT